MSTLPEMILEDLRWKADQAIINYEGESVWLKQMQNDPPVVLPAFMGPGGVMLPETVCHGYLTDCCFTAAPCERHAEMT